MTDRTADASTGGGGRRRHRLLLPTAMVLALVVIGTAAWAFSRGPATGSPRPERTGSASKTLALSRSLPFYGLLYTRTPADARIDTAKQRLTTSCMAAQGHRYEPAKRERSESRGLALFGIEPGSDADPEPAAAQSEQPRSQAFRRALFGDPAKTISAQGERFKVTRPATGCQAEAERKLVGSEREKLLGLQLRLGDGESEALSQLQRDARYAAANKRWRTCMRESGYDAADPLALLRTLPRGADLRTHPATVADLRCKERTGYLADVYGRLAQLQQKWLDSHQDVLRSWRALKNRQDDAARRILADAP
ncbi:hypothetical protein ABT160_43715 [Streptomyces sp. NPDC001941]|uniref:hypothetical protein n=1 Tax=Streptomyces sp. NPDC001941 TaxID=3154659 RepID=UPI003324C224